jgi:UDPglucose 6-dehydrogenase
MDNKVAVVGTGYVGLTTGACFAHLGHQVTCADIDLSKVERLRRGEIPIYEPGLEALVAEGIASGRLSFTDDPVAAASEAGFVYLCVPTPQGDDGSADLSYLEAAARQIGPHLQAETIVVNKSTVPVGSANFVAQVIGRGDIQVVSNPEFLREGTAVHDFLNPDRVVIGADDQSAAIRIAGLYLGLPAPLMVTDPASAETIKYASNAFLAMKLSFVNAIANLCEVVGADVSDVVLGMGYDKRIGHDFLRPGPGWGGSCFPKDSRALRYMASEAGYEFGILDAVLEANEEQFGRVADKVVAMVGHDIAGVKVAAWGLAFKANTDDRRDSPSINVLRRLVAMGAEVTAFDPTVSGPIPELVELNIADDPITACQGAEVLVVLTEWDDFKWVDLDEVKSAMSTPRIVDGRNLLDRSLLLRRGFEYDGIGRH